MSDHPSIDDAKRMFEVRIDEYSVVLWPPFTDCLDWRLARKPWPPPILIEFTGSFQFRPTPWPPPSLFEMRSVEIQLRPIPWPSFDIHIVVQPENLWLLKFGGSEIRSVGSLFDGISGWYLQCRLEFPIWYCWMQWDTTW
jgi:hypothetical protein